MISPIKPRFTPSGFTMSTVRSPFGCFPTIVRIVTHCSSASQPPGLIRQPRTGIRARRLVFLINGKYTPVAMNGNASCFIRADERDSQLRKTREHRCVRVPVAIPLANRDQGHLGIHGIEEYLRARGLRAVMSRLEDVALEEIFRHRRNKLPLCPPLNKIGRAHV